MADRRTGKHLGRTFWIGSILVVAAAATVLIVWALSTGPQTAGAGAVAQAESTAAVADRRAEPEASAPAHETGAPGHEASARDVQSIEERFASPGLIGRNVKFPDLRLEEEVGHNAFLATAEGGKLLVVFRGPAGPGHIAGDTRAFGVGDTLIASGVIQEFPDYEEAARRWNLTAGPDRFQGMETYMAVGRAFHAGEADTQAGSIGRDEPRTRTGERTRTEQRTGAPADAR